MLDHVHHLVNGQDRLGDEAVAGAVGEGLRSRGQYSSKESFRQGLLGSFKLDTADFQR